MTTTTPDIPLPAGFVGADAWQTYGAEMPYRIIFGADRTVTDHAVHISTAAFQLADGSIETRASGAPGIAILDGDRDTGLVPLTTAQARELARALIAAAEELDALTEGEVL